MFATGRLASLWLATALTLQAGIASAQANPPFRIGVSNDQSGPYADQGGPGSAVAARMAAEDFGGTVLGRKIEILVADNQNKPDIAGQIARRWFEVDGVSAITDGGSSASGLAAHGIAARLKKVTLISGGTAPEFSGSQCSPTGLQWGPSSYSMANSVVRTLAERDGKKWFFLSTDLLFGHALEAEATKALKAMGGTVVGSVKHPLNTADFSSYLLQGQASKADVFTITAGGSDLVTAVRQAKEYKVSIPLASLYVTQAEIDAMGPKAAEGLRFANAFYWNLNDNTRSWAQRFKARHGKMPSMIHANTYAAVTHYLQAVAAAKTDAGDVVTAKMHTMPVNNSIMSNVSILPNGRVIMDMFVVEVRNGNLEMVSTVPAKDAFEDYRKANCQHLFAGK